MNQAYVDEDQNPDPLAQQAQLLKPKTNKENFNQKEINNKGKFLSLHFGGIAYLY